MAIAWSSGHKFVVIDSSTSLLFRQGIHDLLTSCGWSAVATTDGYYFSAESPQGLFFKLHVWDRGVVDGFEPCLSLQVMSEDESLVGMEHLLMYGPDSIGTHYAIAGKCQFFIAIPAFREALGGLPVFAHTLSFQCGIPHIPAPSNVQCNPDGTLPDVVSMAWWACSSGGSLFTPQPDFRNNFVCATRWDLCWNGVLMFPQGGDTESRFADGRNGGAGLRLMWMSDSGGANPFAEVPPRLYGIHDPLYLDAVVAWQHVMRAQIWDAFVITKTLERDTVQRFEEGKQPDGITPIYSYWRVWGGPPGINPFGSLLLLDGQQVDDKNLSDYVY